MIRLVKIKEMPYHGEVNIIVWLGQPIVSSGHLMVSLGHLMVRLGYLMVWLDII